MSLLSAGPTSRNSYSRFTLLVGSICALILATQLTITVPGYASDGDDIRSRVLTITEAWESGDGAMRNLIVSNARENYASANPDQRELGRLVLVNLGELGPESTGDIIHKGKSPQQLMVEHRMPPDQVSWAERELETYAFWEQQGEAGAGTRADMERQWRFQSQDPTASVVERQRARALLNLIEEMATATLVRNYGQTLFASEPVPTLDPIATTDRSAADSEVEMVDIVDSTRSSNAQPPGREPLDLPRSRDSKLTLFDLPAMRRVEVRPVLHPALSGSNETVGLDRWAREEGRFRALVENKGTTEKTVNRLRVIASSNEPGRSEGARQLLTELGFDPQTGLPTASDLPVPPRVKSGKDVTIANIREAMAGAEFLPAHPIQLPKVQWYVDMALAGSQAPPIDVRPDNTIDDGHHRYVAARLTGRGHRSRVVDRLGSTESSWSWDDVPFFLQDLTWGHDERNPYQRVGSYRLNSPVRNDAEMADLLELERATEKLHQQIRILEGRRGNIAEDLRGPRSRAPEIEAKIEFLRRRIWELDRAFASKWNAANSAKPISPNPLKNRPGYTLIPVPHPDAVKDVTLATVKGFKSATKKVGGPLGAIGSLVGGIMLGAQVYEAFDSVNSGQLKAAEDQALIQSKYCQEGGVSAECAASASSAVTATYLVEGTKNLFDKTAGQIYKEAECKLGVDTTCFGVIPTAIYQAAKGVVYDFPTLLGEQAATAFQVVDKGGSVSKDLKGRPVSITQLMGQGCDSGNCSLDPELKDNWLAQALIGAVMTADMLVKQDKLNQPHYTLDGPLGIPIRIYQDSPLYQQLKEGTLKLDGLFTNHTGKTTNRAGSQPELKSPSQTERLDGLDPEIMSMPEPEGGNSPNYTPAELPQDTGASGYSAMSDYSVSSGY